MSGIISGLLIPFLGTVSGASLVFFMKKDMPANLRKALSGFAAGVMIAAAVWSLLIPCIEMGADKGSWAVMPAAVGFLAGIGLMLIIDYVTPHLHLCGNKPEGIKSRLSRTTMLALAVTIHNLPEGMAVGAVLAGALQESADISPLAALVMSLGIAIQNIPEGAIISMPVRAEGNSRKRSFIIGSMSGLVEPLGGLAVILSASVLTPVLPYMLAFAAGAMVYVVVEELIPDTAEGSHSNIGVIGFSTGFTLMMILDVVLG